MYKRQAGNLADGSVRVTATGPDGRWPLVVHPDGSVGADDTSPTVPSPPEQTATPARGTPLPPGEAVGTLALTRSGVRPGQECSLVAVAPGGHGGRVRWAAGCRWCWGGADSLR